VKIRFGAFTLDSETRQLRRDGEELHLSRKAFDLLAILVAHRPGVVDKETLRDRLWGDTTVVAANLNNLASEIRAVLRDDPQQPRFLRTVHRVGYAFCGAAVDDPAPAPAAEPAPRCWLVWKDRNYVLSDARTLIGRDPECAIWIDAPGVSRRHASISVASDRSTTTAAIEDLGSTNGTFVEGRRVTRPVALDDGDAIQVGEATLTYHTWSSAEAPTKRIARGPRQPRPNQPRKTP
jgi:DNA-binding winged helix-turn-helix (wHTH) protein